MTSETWHRCSACDVKWHGHEAICFVCGEPGDLCPPPVIRDTSLYVPISEKAWAEVRRQIGVD